MSGTRPEEASPAEAWLPRRALVVGLARSGLAAAAALARRGVQVVAADRSPDVDAGRLGGLGVELRLGTEEEALLEGVELVVKSPGVPARVAARRRRARARHPGLERGRARLPAAARGLAARSASPARTGRRRRPSCSARSSAPPAGPSRSPATSAARSPTSPSSRRRTRRSSASSRASSSRTSTRSPATSPSCSTSSPTTSTATAPSRRTATRSCASSSAHARRSCRAASGSTESSSLPTTRCPRSRSIPGRHNRENAAAATAAARAAGVPDDAIAEALRTFPGVPHRLELVRELRRRPLGQRLEGDEHRRRAPRRRGLRRAAPPHPRRLAQGRGLRAVRARPPGRTSARSTSSEPRATSSPPHSTPPGASTSAPATSRQPSRSPLPTPSPATSSFSRRLPRATTSSRTSRSAATRSAASSRSSRESEEVPVRVEPARARHGRARPLRARHGVQRDLGVRRARERQPARLRREAGDLRARSGVALLVVVSRLPLRTHPPARADRSSSPRLVLCLGVLAIGARVNGARRWIDVGPLVFQPSELAKLAIVVWTAAYLVAAAAATHAEGARAAARDPRRSSSPASCSSSRTSAPRSRSSSWSARSCSSPGTRMTPARDGVRDRLRARCDRRVVVAVPARPAAHLPRSVEGPDRQRPPERAGADQPRLGRRLRPRARPGHPQDPLPARGAHRHDLRRHRRGARARRRRARPRWPIACFAYAGLRLAHRAARIRSESGSRRASRRSSAGRRRSTSPPSSGSRR